MTIRGFHPSESSGRQNTRVTVRQCRYSVPARMIGRRVRVLLRVGEVIVLDGRREIARHPRAVSKGAVVLELDHYLEVLVRKPGALPAATALVQARASGAFAVEREAFWAAARKALGDAGGTRALVEVLLLHRHLDRDDVLAALRAAATVGATSPDVVAVEARRIAEQRATTKTATGTATDTALSADVEAEDASKVVSLTERRLADPQATAALPADTRPLPSVDAYDELLARRRTSPSAVAPSPSPTAGEVS